MSGFHSFTPAEGHGLPHGPFKALIAPRPIGWISSVSPEGAVNLAPYSFFNAFSETPPIIGFSSTGRKDSLSNIEATGAFVHNVVGGALAERMNATSGTYPHGTDEMALAGLTALPSDVVAPPRVAEAPASMECKLVEVREVHAASGAPTGSFLVLGEVVRIHIAERYLVDGLVDEIAIAHAARLGYLNFSKVENVFPMRRPVVGNRG